MSLKDLQYECYGDANGFPCIFPEFQTKRGHKYPNFQADSVKFNALAVGTAPEACIVLEFKGEEDKIYPWYVCPVDAAELPNLQKAIRNDYSELITKMPLD